jgi:hypothetical protein
MSSRRASGTRFCAPRSDMPRAMRPTRFKAATQLAFRESTLVLDSNDSVIQAWTYCVDSTESD